MKNALVTGANRSLSSWIVIGYSFCVVAFHGD